MKKTNFKRILSFFLAAVMLFGMLPAVFAQDADTKDVDYAITNPYATVDWKNYGQYKASLHNHSIVSDGDNDFRYVIETYYSMGYDILAITDHGTVDRGWTEPNYVPALQLALGFRRENGFESDGTDSGALQSDNLRQRQRRPRNAPRPLRHREQPHFVQQLACQLLVR